jgi:hypothetical protein
MDNEMDKKKEEPVKKKRGRPPKKNITGEKTTVATKSKVGNSKKSKSSSGQRMVINQSDIQKWKNSTKTNKSKKTMSSITNNFIVKLNFGENYIEKMKKSDIKNQQFDYLEDNEPDYDKYFDLESKSENIPVMNKYRKHKLKTDNDLDGIDKAKKYLFDEYNLLKRQLNISEDDEIKHEEFLTYKKIKLPNKHMVFENGKFDFLFDRKNKETEITEITEHASIDMGRKTLNNYTNNKVKIQFLKTHSPYNKNEIKTSDDFMYVKNLTNKTNIVCWNDGGHFDGKTIVIPFMYENGTYYVYGNFCSFSCALRYLYDRYRYSSLFTEQLSLLYMFYLECAGKEISIDDIQLISMSPEVITLCSYGGIYTLQQYRDYSNTNRVSILHQPNIVAMNYQVEEFYSTDNVSKYIPVNIQNISDTITNKFKEDKQSSFCGINMKKINIGNKDNSKNKHKMSIDSMINEQLSYELSNDDSIDVSTITDI